MGSEDAPMSEKPPAEAGGGHGSRHAARIADWLNSLDQSGIPPRLRKHDGGKFTGNEVSMMPPAMKQRVIDAFNRRGQGDPFPHFDNPDAGGSGGPGGNGGPGPGGGGNPGGGGPRGNQRRGAPGGADRRAEAVAEYGFSMAFLNHHPELKRLFNQAVAGSWSTARFVAELRDTRWFQQNSATARQFSVNRLTDPASWQADLDRTQAHIRNTWGSLMGVPLSQHLAHKWAFRAMRLGWTDEQINDHLVSSMNFRKLLHNDSMGGTAAQTANQMRAMAADYGIDAGNHWYARQMEAVLKGNDTMDGVQNQLKERAKNKYEAFADQLDAGKTMREIADPYVQSMSQLLEMNPGQIQLKNRLINQALTRRVDGKTQPLSLGDFEDVVRKDPRWMHTQQAKDQFAQTAYGLLSNWGLI